MKRFLALALALTMICSLFLGCTKKQEPKEPEQPNQPAQTEEKDKAKEPHGTLTQAVSNPITALNPHTYTSSVDGEQIEFLMGKLYKFFPGDNGTYDFTSELADGDPVAMNDEGTLFQIKLTKNAKWTDGSGITVDDFLYSFQKGLDPVMKNGRASTIADDYIAIVNAKEYATQGTDAGISWDSVGLKKVDDYTLEVQTKAKQTTEDVKAHFSQTWMAVVNKTVYEANMAADGVTTLYGTEKDKVMSCGAFTIDNWVKGSEITYARNPDYVRADLIHIEKLRSIVVKDAGTSMQLFETGQIDFVGLSSDNIPKFEEDPRVLSGSAAGVMHLTINSNSTNNPILGDADFRRALYYAVDRATMAKLIHGIPAQWVLPKKMIGDVEKGIVYRDMDGSKAILPENNGYDTAKAKEYFDKAYEKNGSKKVIITLNYSDSGASYKLMSEFMQKSLLEIFGADRFELKLQGMPYNQLSDAQKQCITNPNSYEMAWAIWNHGNPLAPWNATKVWLSDYGSKNEPYNSPEFDALWNRANKGEERFDNQKRLELTWEMEKKLIDDAVVVPITEGALMVLKNDRVVLPSEQGYIPKIGFPWMYATIEE